MSYAVFRTKGYGHTSCLYNLCQHNKYRNSETNPDIDHSKSDENITLLECQKDYIDKFNEITKEYKEQHDKRMETMRADRQKTFKSHINDSPNNVCQEFVFSASPDFFEGKNKEEIKEWAEKSLEFVEKDIGIKKENVIHAVVHLDEKTPHLHIMAVPLAEKYDKRRKEDVLSINFSAYVKDEIALANLQTVYAERMKENGYGLQRGIHSEKEHIETLDYKIQDKLNSYIEIDKSISEIENIEIKKTLLNKDERIIKEQDLKELQEKSKEAVALKQKLKVLEPKAGHLEKENQRLYAKLNDLERIASDMSYRLLESEKDNKELYKFIEKMKEIDPKFNQKIEDEILNKKTSSKNHQKDRK